MKQQYNLSDEELQQLYVMQATEQPSQALDEAILEQAKLHKATFKPNKSDKVVFLSQYRWPISTAASVLLVSTLLLLNNEPHNISVSSDELQKSAPIMEVQVMSTAAPKARQLQKSETVNIALSEQVTIVNSDNQLKQLHQLIKDKQWVDADKLMKRIQQEQPELFAPLHPHYKEWLALREQIAIELAK